MTLPVISLMGPTAAGKTDLAIALCQHLDSEIISVDSALIYKGMDIGTAKPTLAEQQQAKHHLIDICDPLESYSTADFRRDALALITDLHQRGKVPILVGGTMMYFKTFIDGLSPLPEACSATRAEIQAQADALGWDVLHQQLAEVDPEAAARIHPNDPQRINRALEVYRLTGQSMTVLQQQKSPPLPFDVLQFAIAPTERSTLHQRIEQRFELMLAQGFKDEVAALYQRGDLHADLPSIRCVGYRQLWDFFTGQMTFDQAVERGKIATRQLAKRQMTWLNGWPDVTWLTTGDKKNLQVLLSSLS